MAEETKTTLGAADILEVMKLLPHRYPFLLIDKIIEIDGNNSAIGIKNVTVNEPHFTGHFPDRPIMPGVLIVEAMAQTAGAICARSQGEGGYLVYFMTIDNARFRRPVVPGDRLKFTWSSSASGAMSSNFIARPRSKARWWRKLTSVR